MQPIAKLHYYPLYARGQSTRAFLSHLKIEYQQFQIEPHFEPFNGKEKWEEIKDNYEFRKIPVLEIDGYKLSQSRSILKYLAVKHGYAPTDPYDIWRNDSLVDHYYDIETGYANAFHSGNRKVETEKFIKSKMPILLPALEKRLKQNSSQQYFVGNNLTVSDVVWVNFFWSLLLNENMEKEKLEQAQKLVKNFPTLFNYITKRKGDFPRLSNRKPQIV